MATLAENLKRLREARSLTQEGLGTLTGLKQTAISRYEKGKSLPDLSSALKLATGLRVSLETLVEGEDVRFDVMYGNLRVSMETTGDDIHGGAEPAPDPTDLPFDQIIPGAPTSGAARESTPPDVEEAHAQLQRIAADLLAVSKSLATRPVPVARSVGPGIRPRDSRRRTRPHPKHAKAATQKRR